MLVHQLDFYILYEKNWPNRPALLCEKQKVSGKALKSLLYFKVNFSLRFEIICKNPLTFNPHYISFLVGMYVSYCFRVTHHAQTSCSSLARLLVAETERLTQSCTIGIHRKRSQPKFRWYLHHLPSPCIQDSDFAFESLLLYIILPVCTVNSTPQM